MLFISQIGPKKVRISTLDPRAHMLEAVESASFTAEGDADLIAHQLRQGVENHIACIDSTRLVYCKGDLLPGNTFTVRMPLTILDPKRHIDRVLSSEAVIVC